MAFWHIFGHLACFSPFLVFCTVKNLATLAQAISFPLHFNRLFLAEKS
jgi:hypothetical protein